MGDTVPEQPDDLEVLDTYQEMLAKLADLIGEQVGAGVQTVEPRSLLLSCSVHIWMRAGSQEAWLERAIEEP